MKINTVWLMGLATTAMFAVAAKNILLCPLAKQMQIEQLAVATKQVAHKQNRWFDRQLPILPYKVQQINQPGNTLGKAPFNP